MVFLFTVLVSVQMVSLFLDTAVSNPSIFSASLDSMPESLDSIPATEVWMLLSPDVRRVARSFWEGGEQVGAAGEEGRELRSQWG